MSNITILIITAVTVSVFTVRFLIPLLVYICYKKNITDVPDQRKLQRRPVPVLGGMAVYVGAIISLLASVAVWHFMGGDSGILDLFIPITISCIMFYVGLFDDIIGMSPRTKFTFQIITVLLLFFIGMLRINEFHGLFGIEHIAWYLSLPLSILVGVGIMNAINLIDGVNGLSSGMGIFSSTICGILCLLRGDTYCALLAFIFAGALVPFFVYNVFSKKFKIFIGDSGSLVMGTMAYVLIARILKYDPDLSYTVSWYDNYLVSLLLAVYSMPVFDCLRVMCQRMKNKKSPFKADKTHLHHFLINAGCSHFLTTIVLVGLNMVVFGFWALTAWMGINVSMQFILVFMVAFACCYGVYIFFSFVEKQPERARKTTFKIRRFLNRTKKYYYCIQRLVDRKAYHS